MRFNDISEVVNFRGHPVDLVTNWAHAVLLCVCVCVLCRINHRAPHCKATQRCRRGFPAEPPTCHYDVAINGNIQSIKMPFCRLRDSPEMPVTAHGSCRAGALEHDWHSYASCQSDAGGLRRQSLQCSWTSSLQQQQQH